MWQVTVNYSLAWVVGQAVLMCMLMVAVEAMWYTVRQLVWMSVVTCHGILLLLVVHKKLLHIHCSGSWHRALE